MNNQYIVFVLITIFTLCVLITIAVNITVGIIKGKDRKFYMSKEKLQEYEDILHSFLRENDIAEGSNVFDIVKKLGYTIEETDNLSNTHEAEKVDNKILVDNTLSYRVKTFGIAHEVAHIVRGDKASVARATHSFKRRNFDEQICDYIAAALLLPYSDMCVRLKKANYSSITRKERIRFINDLAEEKNISEEVVIRRIYEVKVLSTG